MKRSLRLWLALSALASAPWLAAQPLDEYAVKAGFVLNFVAVTEWPEDTGPSLQVCVLGQAPADVIARSIDGKPAAGRGRVVRAVGGRGTLAGCHVVFVGREEYGSVPRVLEQLGHSPVLTIGETDGAARRGMMINMVIARERIAFEINQTAIRRTPLAVSSKLMRLAVTVY